MGTQRSRRDRLDAIKGGPSWIENEVAACARCNHARGHSSPVAWLEECERRGLSYRLPRAPRRSPAALTLPHAGHVGDRDGRIERSVAIPGGALMDELRWPASSPTLTGELVVLRPWRPDDADAVFAACQDPDIQRWTMVPVPYRRDHASSFVAEVAPSDWSSRRGASFAVADGDDGRLLGSCGVVRIDAPHRLGEIGYWVAPWARTKGVASGAVRLATSWAMDDLGLDRLELHIEPENVASCAVAERAGYIREALLRSKILHRGARRDIVIYSALR